MKSKTNRSTLILIVVFVVGLSLLLYPSISNWWNSFHATRLILDYSDIVHDLDVEDYTAIWEEARRYNELLPENNGRFHMNDSQREQYNNLLNVAGNGIMGYIEIPSIHVKLPVYHTIDDAVLQVAIGHLEGSSLPVGGASSHCVVSGHRGLPSAKLFSDLDELAEGDIFLFRILDETLTYQVDQILTVEPEDTSALEIVDGEDLCTLVTCTPYGVNTHRMLVRGHRIDNLPEEYIRVTAEAAVVDPMLVAPMLAAPILVCLFIWVMIRNRKK